MVPPEGMEPQEGMVPQLLDMVLLDMGLVGMMLVLHNTAPLVRPI